jgi:hypothetical protein
VVAVSCPRCAHCRGSMPRPRKAKSKRIVRTISVSAVKYAEFEKAAKERGWTLARLVEEATR